ncbi:hypothetical protein SAMN06297144_0492 [Sphingomonas guangdongensis]|uniref:TonB protein C-terminal n=1 Tax=Sphingomonas guangdongensis TaxID=1141890 RepID=A0A285QCZ6_9SPHN|nr:hypothetical protein [Sphingomonas guangdongensis]SOB79329.1 hypothetical protein SAMN06297144_0492 [Sphingomonas guangdongensis]
MSSLAALLLIQATPLAPVPPPSAVALDLARMPPLPWRTPPRVPGDAAYFLAREVAAGRCPLLRPPVALEFAVLVQDGAVRAVKPLAIDCVTVEQYGAGIISTLARKNLRRTAAGWYRARLVVPAPR